MRGRRAPTGPLSDVDLGLIRACPDVRWVPIFDDIAPDDQQFLMARSYQQDAVSTATAPRYVLVLNFFEELKRLVPPCVCCLLAH